jgi:hypothetical protein
MSFGIVSKFKYLERALKIRIGFTRKWSYFNDCYLPELAD